MKKLPEYDSYEYPIHQSEINLLQDIENLFINIESRVKKRLGSSSGSPQTNYAEFFLFQDESRQTSKNSGSSPKSSSDKELTKKIMYKLELTISQIKKYLGIHCEYLEEKVYY